MEKERLYLTSSVVELSDEEDKPYITLTNRLCWYGEPNLNDVELPVEGAEEKAQTLLDMPVQAKYKKIANKDDLGGHEVYRDPVTGEVKFGTMSVGTHVAVEVKDDTVNVYGEEKTLPCLFATSKVWKRYQNVVSAIKRLFSENKLHSSWEIEYNDAEIKGGVKELKNYWFIGNCMLGSTTTPAYPCADTLAVASVENEDSLYEAATLDATEDKEEQLKDEQDKVLEPVAEPTPDVSEQNPEPVEPETEPVVEPAAEGEPAAEPEKEQASLTTEDIYRHLNRALDEMFPNDWIYVMYILPEEHAALCHRCGADELTFLLVNYEVVDDEVRIVGEVEEVKIAVSISEINSELSKRDAAIAEASVKIQNLESELETLKPYKEEADRIAAEKAEAELAEKRKELAEYATRSNLITDAEVAEGGALYDSIKALDKSAIDAEIAQRYMSGIKPAVAEQVKEKHATRDVASIDDGENINAVMIYINK